MRVSKQWTNEHRTTRKTGSGRRKICQRTRIGMAVNDHTASSRQLAAHWSTTIGVLISASSIRRRLLHRGLRARVPLYRISLTANHRRLRLGSPSRQTIDGCVCNGFKSTEPGRLIGTKLSFQMNHASICGTMRVAFMFVPMNAAFRSTLSNDIVA
ncbi:HTH_Tnp_Tc3_2 domain-containing protein [Trichonephila clavipes]|nr:HTH_Tnp_Tc3_2 domain-containing protein [Trichonephila clavipes]